MKVDRYIRLAAGLLIFLLVVIAIAAILFVSESAFSVWDRLQQGPAVLLYGYLALLGATLVVGVWLVFRFVIRRKKLPRQTVAAPLDRASIEHRLGEAERAGIDVSEAQSELRDLASRQQSGSIHLCFFGEVSSGKSSLIKALAPHADVVVDVNAGSTTDIRHFRWRDSGGNQILLTDVPGIGGHTDRDSAAAIEEARRAQLVLYVCSGDLNREEVAAVKSLLLLEKPLVLVLNKTDRYSNQEQAMLMQRLLDRLQDVSGESSRDHVVAVTAGGVEEFVAREADGSQSRQQTQRQADVGVLVVAINKLLDDNAESLDLRRDRAVFHLAEEKLLGAEAQYREQRGAQIIRNSTRKAVIGALAAISPGTDILIQGYIGTDMTQALCRLYGSRPRDLDVEEFLSLSQSRAGKALPLSLAVAGNAFKAFPGLGTVAGGLVHAVAYGLLFDALGHSLVVTLRKHGELIPERASQEFGEIIGEHMEANAQKIAEIALEREKTSRGR